MRFQCPLCNGIVAIDNSSLGIKVQCGHCSGVIDVPDSRVAPGAIIADFIIQRELGRGGMGVVYLAHQISLDRPSALKILSENYANDAQFVGNFIKEARAQFASGERDPYNDADWAAYVKSVEDIGAATLIKNAQSAYDRSKQ